jgi:phosphoserine phosphatase
MRDGKIRMARKKGILNGGWDFGYTDSAHDIPLLSHCRHRFLVNPSRRTARNVKKALPDRVTVLNWSETSLTENKGKQ